MLREVLLVTDAMVGEALLPYEAFVGVVGRGPAKTIRETAFDELHRAFE
jgi:hypothetical protein